jgi:hypothetical protein
MLQKKCELKNVIIGTSIFENEDTFKTVSMAWWDRSIAYHVPINKLPDINEVWKYLGDNLFSEFLKL